MAAGSNFRDSLERVIPFALPAIGGLAAVIWVNLNPMQFLNPMIWIPLGIFLGWVAGRSILHVMNRWL